MLPLPPVSITVHSMLTCPEPFESAPYFPALVASSCSAMVNIRDRAGVKRSVGPSHRNAVAGERLERAVNRIAHGSPIPAFLSQHFMRRAKSTQTRKERISFQHADAVQRRPSARKGGPQEGRDGQSRLAWAPTTNDGCKDRSPLRGGSGTARALGRHGRPPLVVLCPPRGHSGAAPSFDRRP